MTPSFRCKLKNLFFKYWLMYFTPQDYFRFSNQLLMRSIGRWFRGLQGTYAIHTGIEVTGYCYSVPPGTGSMRVSHKSTMVWYTRNESGLRFS